MTPTPSVTSCKLETADKMKLSPFRKVLHIVPRFMDSILTIAAAFRPERQPDRRNEKLKLSL
jgi:hypothetical protein